MLLDAIFRRQVFGFLLGIDLKGMSGGAGSQDEDDDDQTRGFASPSAAGAQTDAKQAEMEEAQVDPCNAHG